MNKNAYRGHRFPPAIIQITVWMHARFTLSLRDIEELLAERGLDISYETVRRWFLKSGSLNTKRISRMANDRNLELSLLLFSARDRGVTDDLGFPEASRSRGRGAFSRRSISLNRRWRFRRRAVFNRAP